MAQSWAEFLKQDTIFDNAIRLRYFIWTINRLFTPGSKILEVGCGSGTTSLLLADQGYCVTATDIDEQLIQRIKKQYESGFPDNMKVYRVDMAELPWPNLNFDVVIHQGVLEHFDDDRIVAYLREQARVAHWVVFDVPNHRHGKQAFGDERFLTYDHWCKLIQKSGLSIVECYGRDFNRWTYFFPYGLFSRWGLEKWPWFGRRFGLSYMFVCKSGVDHAA